MLYDCFYLYQSIDEEEYKIKSMHYFILILIVLISQDFVLFNEEFLILICFIGFSFIFAKNMGESISNYFTSQTLKIENNICNSYNQVLSIWKARLQFNYDIIKVLNYFLYLRKYYLNFNLKIANKLQFLQLKKKQVSFKTKLQFSVTLETQFFKLVILLLISKINKLIILNTFYSNLLIINSFKCRKSICLREYIESI